jgi:uncharacterized protein (TIGR02611 family)
VEIRVASFNVGAFFTESSGGAFYPLYGLGAAGTPDHESVRAILDRIEHRREVHKQLHWVPRVIVVTFGFLILLAGLAMLVLPGPAIIVIPIGLAILSLEFLWAEMLLDRALESGVSFGGWLGRAVRNRQLVLATAAVLGAAAVIAFTIVI